MTDILGRGKLNGTGDTISRISDNDIDMVGEFKCLLHSLADVVFVGNVTIDMLDIGLAESVSTQLNHIPTAAGKELHGRQAYAGRTSGNEQCFHLS